MCRDVALQRLYIPGLTVNRTVLGQDAETSSISPLFNPRQQQWADHFTWSADGITIIGTTPIGRATCTRLEVNDERYKGERSIQEARALWVQAGWHPPSDDPIASD